MTSPAHPSGASRHRPAPLTQLPDPDRLPEPLEDDVMPHEVLLESRGALLVRLLKAAWVPAIVLLALWELLVVCFVLGTAPTFWAISLLSGGADPSYVAQARALTGFRIGQIPMLLTVVPLIGTAAGLACLPLGMLGISTLRPRMFLGEADFQRAVAVRASVPFILPALLAIALVTVATAIGAPLQWNALGAGALAAVAAALAWTLLAWVLVRRWMSAPRVLGIVSVDELNRRATVGPHEGRSEAARQMLAHDRRHLPPNHMPVAADVARRTLLVTARSWMRFVVPAVLGIAWLVFSVNDIAVLFSRLDAVDPTDATRSELPWSTVVIGLVVGLAMLAGLALTPTVVLRIRRPRQGDVDDLRTYSRWADRARVNRWEADVVRMIGQGHAMVAAAALIVVMVLLAPTGGLDRSAWTWAVCDAAVLLPLIGAAGTSAMRGGLREVLYGPAGWYMRRDTPWAAVTPRSGTRTAMAQDPARRARMEQRLREADGPNALVAFDAGERVQRLWVDDAQPGARDVVLDQDMIARGELPDFGMGNPPGSDRARTDPFGVRSPDE
jgi:hypothetical protein